MAIVVLAAGGTGGHLFPAQALAEVLVKRGYTVHLMTDERVKDYGKSFPAAAVHEIPSATLSLSQAWLAPLRLVRLWRGIRKARSLMQQLAPVAVVGFGGYPSFPPLIAAARLDIPAVLHDQNAVMGRANRMLARRATAIAASFATIANLPPGSESKVTFTGNPVRAVVRERAGAPYPPAAPSGEFRLLVFGGSQGAQFFSRFVPQALALLPPPLRQRLRLTQQCRPEDLEVARQAFAALGIAADLQSFFMDMPRRMAEAHLVLCRAGASTVAELGVIGRPAVLVPLPHAIDNDQLKNAESIAASGAAWVMPQATLTPQGMADLLSSLSGDAAGLAKAAAAALVHGKPDAAERLANLVEATAGLLHKKGTL